MFSGIIEQTARLVALRKEASNLHLTFTCAFAAELSIDQSVAHNGVCLTVVALSPATGDSPATYTVTAIEETLSRSNLGALRVGDRVNVERAMPLGDRLDGHIVQGHVDGTAVCTAVTEREGSHVFTFRYAVSRDLVERGYFTVDKGSVAVNGVSLTVCDPAEDAFSVAIIPYTFEHTNFGDIRVGTVVNLEFDILGKYLARLQSLRHTL